MSDPRPSPFLEPTDAACRDARRIVREARHAALACLQPGSGNPLASRVAVVPDITGDPVILVSHLSAHTSALLTDPRASLLFGTPGPGDPLAHPRVSVRGLAERIPAGHPDRERVRRRFLARTPPAEIYVDFADFEFIRIVVTQALFNGGFARAYRLERADLTEEVGPDVAEAETRVRLHMNEDHAEAVDRLVSARVGEACEGWTIATIDRRGFEAVKADDVIRVEFHEPVTQGGGFRAALVALIADLT